jgi:hypothetical protein
LDDPKVQEQSAPRNGELKEVMEIELERLSPEWDAVAFGHTIIRKRVKIAKVKQSEYTEVGS